MKKLLFFSISCFLTIVSCSNAVLVETIYAVKVGSHKLYYSEDFEELKTIEDIHKYIAEHVDPISENTNDVMDENWQNPEETLRLGTGDCEDYVILFMNILYFVTGEKSKFCLVNALSSGNTYDDINHAAMKTKNGLIEAQSGASAEYVIILVYDFDRVFDL